MPRKVAPKPPTPTPTTTPPVVSFYPIVEALAADQLTDLGGGEYTYTVGARPGLTRDDGTPAKAGDVLSVQADGSQQTRPQGTSGPYERCCKSGASAAFRPTGKDGRTFLIPLALDAPNK